MEKKTLGSRIRELREEKDISLRELARKLDEVSAAHVSDIELGRRNPSKDLLKKIATQLGVPIEDLEKYDTRPPIEQMKRVVQKNPAYGVALRTLLDKQVSPEEILKLARQKPEREKKE